MAAPAPDSYGAEWSIFADWCEATRRISAPASVDTVLEFLTACPAKAATLMRRIAGINAAHAALGLTQPGHDPSVKAALRVARGLSPGPDDRPRFDPSMVAAGLERAAVRGWPDGAVGRRDAALVVTVCMLGLSRPQATALTLGDITGPPVRVTAPPPFVVPVTPGTSPASRTFLGTSSTSPGTSRKTIEVEASLGPGPCPACAFVRWQRTAVLYARGGMSAVRRVMASQHRGEARERDRHACLSPAERLLKHVPTPLRNAPLFVPIDRHGWPATEPLSIRSITTVVTGLLAAGQEPVAEVEPAQRGVPQWTQLDPRPLGHAEGVRRQHSARQDMAAVERLLDELDAAAEAAEAAIAASQEVLDDASCQMEHIRELG